jgi:tetrahydromethanopterin S-methyltransferase subunit F
MNSNYRYFYNMILVAALICFTNLAFSGQMWDGGKTGYFTLSVSEDTVVVEAAGKNNKMGRIGFYVDYLSLASQLIGNNKILEGGAHLMVLSNLSLVVEGGTAIHLPKSSISNGEYRSEGTFWKAGMDFIVNYNRESDSRIYVGARYGKTSFDDQGIYEVASSLWPSYKATFAREGLMVEWFELLMGTEGNIFGGFYTGWMVRYRMLANSPGQFPIPIYHIPGFGTGTGKNTFAFNLYLKYLIRW